MNHIEELFGKFRKIFARSTHQKTAIAEVFKIHSGVQLDISKIQIQGRTIFVEASPTIKNQIFINKEKIINILNSRLNEKFADIK